MGVATDRHVAIALVEDLQWLKYSHIVLKYDGGGHSKLLFMEAFIDWWNKILDEYDPEQVAQEEIPTPYAKQCH